MKKIFLIIIVLLTINLFAEKLKSNQQLMGKPFIILDCQKYRSALSKSCLYHLNYISNRIRFAGVATEIYSLTSIEYLTLVKSRYFYTRIYSGKTGYWQKNWMLKRLKKIYQSLTNYHFRKHLIRIKPIGQNIVGENLKNILPDENSSVVKSLVTYLTRKHIGYNFYFQTSFQRKLEAYFSLYTGVVQVKFANPELFHKKENHRLIQEIKLKLLKNSSIKDVFSILDFEGYLKVLLTKSKIEFQTWQSLLEYNLLLPQDFNNLLDINKNEILIYIKATSALKNPKEYFEELNQIIQRQTGSKIHLKYLN